jgi:hypothetical protein
MTRTHAYSIGIGVIRVLGGSDKEPWGMIGEGLGGQDARGNPEKIQVVNVPALGNRRAGFPLSSQD